MNLLAALLLPQIEICFITRSWSRAAIFSKKKRSALLFICGIRIARAYFNNRYLLASLHFRRSRSFSTHPLYRSATWLFPLAYHGTFRRRISTRRGFYLTFTRSISSPNRFWRPYAMGRERVFRYWQYFSFQISFFSYREIKLSLTLNNRPFNSN